MTNVAQNVDFVFELLIGLAIFRLLQNHGLKVENDYDVIIGKNQVWPKFD